MRTITVFNTDSNEPFSFESDATTYGQIKDQLKAGGMKVVVRETRNTLEEEGAALPEGNFTIFLYPTKMKSGWDDWEDSEEEEDEDERAGKLEILNSKVTALQNKVDTIYKLLISSAGGQVDNEVIAAEKAKLELAEQLAAEARELRFGN